MKNYNLNAINLDTNSTPYILFDTNALIYLVRYKADGLLEDLKKNYDVCPIYTELIRIEALYGKSEAQNIKIASLLEKFDIAIQSNKDFYVLAEQIQFNLARFDVRPTAIDITLGATLASYKYPNIYLLTANIKDFPMPIYEREGGYIILEDKKSVSCLSLLQINKNQLKPVELVTAS